MTKNLKNKTTQTFIPELWVIAKKKLRPLSHSFGHLHDTPCDIRHASEMQFLNDRKIPLLLSTMGTKSKSTHTCLANLPKALQKFTRLPLKNAQMSKTLPMNLTLMMRCGTAAIAQFISTYMHCHTVGLSSADANKKYHGHRTLPPDMAKVVKNHFHS